MARADSSTLTESERRQLTLAETRADHMDGTRGDFDSLVDLFKLSRDVYREIAVAVAAIVLGAVAVMIAARVLGRLVDQITAGKQLGDFAYLATAFLALEGLAVVMQFSGRLGLAKITTKVALRVRLELFRKLRALPISYFDVQPLGRTVTRLTSDVEGMEGFFSGTLARLLTSMIQIIAVLIAMMVTHLHFGFIVVISSLPALFFAFALRAPIRHWLRVYKQRSAYLNAKLAEYLNGIPVIKIFGLENWTGRSFEQAAFHHYESGLSLMNWNSFIRPMSIFLSVIPTIVILWYGGVMVLEGTMALGIVVAFVRFSERFASPIRTISQEIQTIQEAIASSERIRQMLAEKEEPEVIGREGSYDSPIRGSISYRNVWMRYVPGRSVLKGINLDVEPGMRVGLVGETGSGKTTTLNLLPRLYPIEKGDILVDGVSIQDWNKEALRRQIGYVSQDVVIVRGTLRENLLGSVPDPASVGPELIMDACRRTGLAQLMRRFPNGLNTFILDGGENLSMGERQLIAFTRMLIKSPAIMILDEATANVDETCEALIQKAITEVLSQRTCFIIAHRLSTILACDKILVFHQGQIVEEGTHRTLMERDGRYAMLVRRQLDASQNV